MSKTNKNKKNKKFTKKRLIRGGQNIEKSIAYVINLDSYKERWRRIQKDFKGSSIKLERFSAIKNNNPLIGCGESFIEIVKKAKEKKLLSVLIFEDDNRPLENFNNNWIIIKKWLDTNLDKWDIFNGGPRFADWGSYTNSTINSMYSDSIDIITELKNNIYICKTTGKLLATNWIYINNSVYDRIINWNIDINGPIDIYLHNTDIFKLIFSIPLLGLQHQPNITNITASTSYNFSIIDPIILKMFNISLEKAKQKNNNHK
jgi:hypothetical protein